MKSDVLEAAVKGYNEKRSPEAAAAIVRLSGRSASVSFTGSFCHTCGVMDYFDDFVITAEELGLNLRISDVREVSFEKYIAKFEEVG